MCAQANSDEESVSDLDKNDWDNDDLQKKIMGLFGKIIFQISDSFRPKFLSKCWK